MWTAVLGRWASETGGGVAGRLDIRLADGMCWVDVRGQLACWAAGEAGEQGGVAGGVSWLGWWLVGTILGF